jgi:cobalt/nickel transport system permease protein
VVALFFLIIAVVIIPDVTMALVGLLVSILLLLISRLPLLFVAKRLLVVCPFVLILSLLILFTHEGGYEVARFGFLSITSEGLARAILIAARAMAAINLVVCMLGTIKFETTLKALEHLKVPTKITQLLMFTYRYIFVLIDEFVNMSTSLASRGFEKRTNMRTMTTLSKMVGMMFIRSYERADRVYNAMVSRGYDGRLKTFARFRMHPMDAAKTGIIVVIGLAINVNLFTGI